ncbi:MAG TPA: 3-hydroxyacyl-ACP dehydratase FabZ [Geminicoccaceae bacterium]|nr:3-hydroxyacyl-ACP dehydratase FabZ [Geminicoccaceae bacterium]
MGTETPAAGTRLADIDHRGILRMLPHRYPMLLVDRVVELEAQRRAVGIKNLTFNEPFFAGHFPGDPIMPGVLIVEALGQASAVLMVASLGAGADEPRSVYFMSIDEARFRRPVRPGDQLRLEVELLRSKLGVWKFRGRGVVDGQLAAEAVYSAKLVDR